MDEHKNTVRSSGNHSLVVHRSFMWWRVVFSGLLFGGLIASVIGVLTFRSLAGQADEVVVQPSPFVDVELKQKLRNFTAPYVRLEVNKEQFGIGSDIPVSMYLHTNNTETVQLDVVIVYNHEQLTFNEKDLAVSDHFKVVDVEELKSGMTKISFFVTRDVGHEPVLLRKDTKIATLSFTTSPLAAENVVVDLQFDQGDEVSGLYAASSQRSISYENILEQVEGVEFDIIE